MTETIEKLFEKLMPVINDESTTIRQKMELIVEQYLTMLLANPDFPLFIVNELLSGAKKLPIMTDNGKMFLKSHFIKQLRDLAIDGKISYHPVNLLLNMLGMIIFPLLARPVVFRSGALNEEDFKQIIDERKKLIPVWLSQIANLS